jgi:hypothetical protein
MAQVKIDLSLQDQSSSIKKRTSEVQNLNKELTKSQQLATGTRTGSGAVKASYSAASESTAYGQARGSMGATGASGRDFANQAQGLGGLVRLYATYAANVFAVSAAFTALSQAMNTTNMVRGLDQLGAASGVALGSLAKRFEQASGGAISLRESMEATAKAVSSGLSQTQFLKLGEVARKASQALGVGMSDAVSRLTRGITKLEPELLDELGIFTKVGKATEDYARSVGKSAEALTDFERRQAFANAVLAEGAQKFGEINIPTNPYDKLLATLKNVAQSILEVVNTAIVPLVNLLASSPAALTLGIAALGSMIVKQAIPAIGEYRKSLKEAAATSKQLADQKLQRAESAAETRRADIQLRSDAAAKAADDKLDVLEKKLREQSSGRIRKDVQKILDPTRNILEIKDTEIDKLDRIGSKLKTQDNIYRQLAQTIREAKIANLEYIATANQLDKERKEAPGKSSTLGVLRAEAETQRKKAASSAIISQAGDTASINGFKAAYTEMITQIKTEKLGLVRGTLTGIAGAANAAATRLGGLVNAFSGYIAIITGAIAIYQMLSGWLSQNSAQQEKFNETIETGNEAVKALNLTFDKYRGSLTSESVIATATAFTNLSDNISATVKSLEEANIKAGRFDRFIDGIKSAFGQGLKADFEKSITFQVSEGLKGITDPKVKKLAEDKLKELLNVNTLTSRSISSALGDIDSSKIIETGKKIATVFESASRAGQKTAGTLSAIKESFTTLDRAYTTLANTLIQKDPLTDFGKELAMQGFNLTEAFKDPIASVSALRDILVDVSKIKLLAPESQQILMQNKDAFIALANSAELYEKQISASEANIKVLQAKLPRERALIGGGAGTISELSREGANVTNARNQLAIVREGMSVVSKEFARAGELSIKRGFEIVERSFVRSMAETSINAQKTVLDQLPKTVGTIDLGVSLDNQKLELQKQEILETQRLIKELELSRLSAEKIALETRRDQALAVATESSVRAAISKAPEARLKEISNRTKVLSSTDISRDIRSGNLERTPETREAMMQQQGAFAKVAAITSQQQLNIIKGDIDKINAFYTTVKRDLDTELKQAVQQRDEYVRGDRFRTDTLEQQQQNLANFAATEASLTRQISLLDNQRELATASKVEVVAQQNGWKNISDEASKAADFAKTQLNLTATSVDKTSELNAQEIRRKNQLDLQLDIIKLQNIQLDSKMKLSKLDGDTQLALLDIQKQELQIQLDKGTITIDSYNQQIVALEKVERVKQRDLKLSQLLQQYTIDMVGYSKEFANATAAQIPEIRARADATNTIYQKEVSGIQAVFDANEKNNGLIERLSDRQKSYSDIVKNSFDGMADAMLNWAETGKWAGKDLFNSLIADLARYELRLQTTEMYKSLRPGLISGISALFNGGPAPEALGEASGAWAPSAKGNAFDYGIQAFAQGGTFTNGIVNSPTLFKFAKGTGLMGEAGPEAIMPLKRDAQGNLGVRGGGSGGNTEVVINNYSTAQAETKETTDSRGNRKIEVTIGDMTAGEIARSGSASQKAVGGTFGLRPQLIRR